MIRTQIVLFLSFAVALAGCATTQEAEAPVEEAKAAEPAPEPEPAKPTFAVMVTHKVADFDAWKTAFDADAEARKAAGFLDAQVSRSDSNPKKVAIYIPGTDRDAANAMLGSEEMKKKMADAGVQGEPEVNFVVNVENNTVKEPLPALVVSHKVKDFATWKAAFDNDNKSRLKAGILGYAVERSADKENQVWIYLQAKDFETLKALKKDKGLRKKMTAAGVEGKPNYLYLNAIK